MRFSTIFVSAALATLTSAQASSSTPTPVSTSLTTSTTITLTPAQSSQAVCLSKCPADDPTCRTKCIVVDASIFGPQNKTVDCIAACPRGNGTAADNLQFEDCQKGCLATASILPTTSAGSTTTTRSGAAATTGTGTAAGSRTSGTTSPSATRNAASGVQAGIMGALIGVGGLAIAFGL